MGMQAVTTALLDHLQFNEGIDIFHECVIVMIIVLFLCSVM